MKYKILLLIIGIFLIELVNGANYFVSNPSNCPVSYLSQGPFSGQVVCGETGGTVYFSAPADINAPTVTHTSNTDYTCSDTTCNGGHIIDCYYYDTSAPMCDNLNTGWCDRNSTCYTTKVRDTTCTANVFAQTTCGNCRTGYQDCVGDDVCEVTTGSTNYPTGANNNYGASCSCACDSNYLDCDAGGCSATNGCEQHVGSTTDNCAVGSNNYLTTCTTCVCDTGYQDCDSSGAGAGNGCEVTTGVTSCTTSGGGPGTYSAGCVCTALVQQNFTTNTLATGFGKYLLWGNQTNSTGWLVNLFNNNSNFTVDNNADIKMGNKITMAFGIVLEAISSTWIKLTGSLWITGDLNVTSTGTFQNITIRDNNLCNETTCFTLQELNKTGAGMDYTNLALTNQTINMSTNQNITLNSGNLNLNKNSSITREGQGTKIWISETGVVVVRFGT